MDAERWERVVELHHEALELDPGERAVFLEINCGQDAELMELLGKMLGELPEHFVEPLTIGSLPSPPDLEGQQLADFQLHRVVGVGGMGTVYLASQQSLERQVAVKVVSVRPGVSEDDLQRFEREARRVATLDHKHIVPVYLAGREGDTAYLAMPYLRGGSLVERLKRAREGAALDQADCVRWVGSIAAALHYVHEQGMQHRDVKPGNILLDEYGQAYLADFGIARRPDQDTLTLDRGTPAYMSPEQASDRPMDFRSDVYSLGVVLYELLAQARPFAKLTGEGLRSAVAHDEPPLLRSVKPGVPRDLETICHTAMAKRPEARYPTAGALALDLELFQNSRPIMARPPAVWERAAHWIAKHKVPAAVLLALLVTAGVAAKLSRSLALRDEVRAASLEVQHSIGKATDFWEAGDPDASIAALEGVLRSIGLLERLTGGDGELIELKKRSLRESLVPIRERLLEEMESVSESSKRDPLGVSPLRISRFARRVWQIEAISRSLELPPRQTLPEMIGTRVALRSSPEGARVVAQRLDPLTHLVDPLDPPIRLGTTPMEPVPMEPGTYHFFFLGENGHQGELIRPIYAASQVVEPPIVFLRPEESSGLIRIPAGAMKIHEEEGERALGAVELHLPTFLAGEHEVTNEEFWQFSQETGHPLPFGWPLGEWGAEWGEVPVAWVPWTSAEAYCAWAGGRLSSYYEWSRMARGADARDSPWAQSLEEGAELAGIANIPELPSDASDTWESQVPKVDVTLTLKPAKMELALGYYLANIQPAAGPTLDRSPEGILNLFGNVAEWTLSSGLALEGDVPFLTPGRAVVRGAHWRRGSRTLADVMGAPMGVTIDYVGFRCVKGPPPASRALARQ